ncbi:Ale2p KNAG_0A07640 [Huiozyma naganishii CBS 8797]|uniref:TLC domain-containing protein n=1 Tax=Huiozyma naganishii (strain ATCC MYA-139 / BCRC 22969 / CBS 8797 / KCTC 17520 / NBRC 10181 / NCYC 3082 / Yp74L-3) TaxID=1071383 RepID=J7RUB6_HUIN7|nr:hypothetical protein KNAG_0A07640 [Kazachstania naganishii CBS 8797]CCK68417.1 hypothetical protein KNAG_0A07640 [Kazachstania naganishii CBS 8797]
MEQLVTFLTGLPALPIFEEKINPFLSSHNLISSQSVLDNLHTVLYIAVFYHIVYLIGAWAVFPIPSKWKVNYDETHAKDEEARLHIQRHKHKKVKHLSIQASIHFISFLQTVVVLYLSFVFFLDRKVSGSESYPDSDARIFGECRETQLVCMFGCGYFIWDAYISACHSTFPFFVHGVVSTAAYYIGLKPYLQYYAPVFLMFELSNPCLNIRWFGLKFFPQESKVCNLILLLNNLLLMTIFFFGRILWGWYQTFMLCYDFYNVRNDPRFMLWDTVIVVTCNLTIDLLNVIWFSSMVSIAVKVLTGTKTVQNEKKTQ